MRLREFRRADAPRFFELLKSEFPEEEAMLGMRPEGFEAIVRRLYRPDTRIVLGLLRALRRSPFHLYVVEDGGAIAATTMLSFAPRAGFLSTVVVAPGFRRRGYARQLIDAARREAARRRRPYVVLRVLEANAPALALYTSAGYRRLDRQSFVVHDAPGAFAGTPAAPAIRPFRRADAAPLAELANRENPPPVREALPVRPRDLIGSTLADRLFSAETAAWVVDRGRGPEAHVAATSTPATEAAHLSAPIVGPTVEPEVALALVRTAGAWLAARQPLRIVTGVADDHLPARRALEEAGFHGAMAYFTLYRASA
jgi:ribosomal protein S18 acetylase RimI-like enzyme